MLYGTVSVCRRKRRIFNYGKPREIYNFVWQAQPGDEREGESNSIQNQRLMLEKYAEDNGFPILSFCMTTLFRHQFKPTAWKELMALVESDQVATLIVKDMSRLGRDYLLVGQFTEIIFPSLWHPLHRCQQQRGQPVWRQRFYPFCQSVQRLLRQDTSRKSGRSKRRRRNTG